LAAGAFAQIPELLPQGVRTMQDRPVYVTTKGKAELEQELEELRDVERPRIIEHLHEVKSGGDWMENTEVMLFEDQLNFVERRIAELEDMLADAELIQRANDDTTVDLGDTVVIQEEDGELETYRIVGYAEANPSEGFISNESPIGRALLTRRVGEEVIVTTPSGDLTFRIVSVK
jgi:transcription elongation factor GreA